jgi:hypothetical protein
MLKTPGGDREMVEVLALVLQHDEQAVLTAVELALETGVPTKRRLLNMLHRLIDGKSVDPPALKPPNALTPLRKPRQRRKRQRTPRSPKPTLSWMTASTWLASARRSREPPTLSAGGI